jgi:hypothetical protein
MPRTKVFRDLEPLRRDDATRAVHAGTKSFPQVLRNLALKNQREQPRVFYSLREIAKRFNVSISTVAKVYRDMEHEGLLSRVRGSKTILNCLRYNRRRVRGFIGLPALLSSFLTNQDYRRFFIFIRRELWLRGFATSLVFFRPHEAADGSLSDQLKSYEVDAVIFFLPGRTDKESMLRLSDMGIRVVGISSIGTPGLPARYYVWRERAIEMLLRDWRNCDSGHKITVVDSKDYRSPVTEEILRVILQNLGIEPVIRTFTSGTAHDFLCDLCRSNAHGVIFPSSTLASTFSFQCPDGISDLLKAHRVAFIDGPIDIPFVEVPEVTVDLVTFDWQFVAETIVNDLITLEAFDNNRHTTFDAQAQLRVPLRCFAETIRPLRT